MRYLLILIALLNPTEIQAASSHQKNPIYNSIVKLKPNVDKKFAHELANSIYRYSKTFGTDPAISVAIAMQESSFENKNRMGALLTKDGRVVRGATDVGVFQIHVHTIANLQDEGQDLDITRLATDVDYQTYWHTKILKRKITTCVLNSTKLAVTHGSEWSCYHSFTLAKRMIYLHDVSTHLAKLTTQ